MIGSEYDKKLLYQYAPYAYRRFLQFEKETGLDVSVRDTDHVYDSFRWGVYVSDNTKPIDNDKYQSLEKDIETHCCICGSNQLVSLRNYDDRQSSAIFERKCACCYGKSIYSIEKTIHFATYNNWCKKQKIKSNTPYIKVRLLNDSGKLFFDWLNNLIYCDEQFYISNDVSEWEHVRYAGIYLNARDIHNERIYEGDVILAQLDNGRQYWGMAFENNSTYGEDKNLAINHIWLYHDSQSFPSPLNAAVNFEIVGNVLETEHSHISQPDLCTYYQGWEEKYYKDRIAPRLRK